MRGKRNDTRYGVLGLVRCAEGVPDQRVLDALLLGARTKTLFAYA